MFKIINPVSNQEVRQFEELTEEALTGKLTLAKETFHKQWRSTSITDRATAIAKLADILDDRLPELAKTMTTEMGKPYSQSEAEVKKCAWLCRYFAAHGPGFLKDKRVEDDDLNAWVVYEPIGAVLGIMPWNFPLWQAFRYAIPAMLAGNVAFLKPASNVAQSALYMQEMIEAATGLKGVFQTILIDHEWVSTILEDPFVQGVALTGSDRAGAAVAAEAGKQIKKVVLELGGSDAFVVLPGADLDEAARIGIKSRMNNSGQTCIAAKRFIVLDVIADRFIEKVKNEVRQLTMGDPMQEGTNIGPLARPDLVDLLEEQVNDAIDKGAQVLYAGGRQEGTGNYFSPVILAGIEPGMRAYEEELFGPVVMIYRVETKRAAIELANSSPYGLGGAVWSDDINEAMDVARQLEAGAISINTLVKSDPRLPFGGVKRSGFGRELSAEGIREFVNVKSIRIGG